jgi:hypothetical protein
LAGLFFIYTVKQPGNKKHNASLFFVQEKTARHVIIKIEHFTTRATTRGRYRIFDAVLPDHPFRALTPPVVNSVVYNSLAAQLPIFYNWGTRNLQIQHFHFVKYPLHQ